MAHITYKLLGFRGLSSFGKLLFLIILLTAASATWIVWGKYKYADATNIAGQIISLAFPVVAGLVIAFIVSFILPKQKFSKREFFCAQCGQFIGTRIETCSNCGSNKYLTDETRARFLRNKRT